jgi:hypothetical protein
MVVLMNQWKSILIVVLLLSIGLAPPASSDVIIARKLPDRQIMELPTTTETSKPTLQPSGKFVSTDSSAHISLNVIPTSDYPLSITKRIINPRKNGYYVNKPIYVLVQVTCLGGRNVDEVLIWEHTDKNLTITSYKKFFRSSVINETINPERYLYKNYSYDIDNNIIYIPIKQMYSRESVVYEYSVEPTEPGIYDSYTVVRIPSDYPIYSDYSVPLEIEAVEEIPDFQVALDARELELEIGEKLPLKYIIKFQGGSSANPCEYNVSLSESEKYSLPKLSFPNELFDQHNNTVINSEIYYFEEGTYSLPIINISGQLYKFDEKVKVINWWRKYIVDPGLAFVTLLLVYATLVPPVIASNFSLRRKIIIIVAFLLILILLIIFLY